MGFCQADRLTSKLAEKTQHVFVATTWPDMGLRSVDAYLVKKFPDSCSWQFNSAQTKGGAVGHYH
jgi:hypothetical protein